jgi:hypothetical protein
MATRGASVGTPGSARAGTPAGSGGGIRSRVRRFALALAVAAAGVAPATAADDAGSRVPMPKLAISAPGQCVEETQFMRRNHMELLKHHRDRTVRDGVRTTQHSLANCVTCHAGRETGRVTGSRDAFCEGCHQYAAVKLDCFECHADRPMAGVAASAVAAPGVRR